MGDGGDGKKLDLWTIVSRSSQPEAHLALALDLRGLALNEVEELATCRELQAALLSSNLLASIGEGLFACRRLRKLDLSRNGITTLPPPELWSELEQLQVLYLHDNHLASLQAAGNLAGCSSLMRLTLHGNPCARHPSYRHYLVNTLFTLRALDLHVISDEELIEGAVFSPALGAKCPASQLPLFAPPEGAEPDEPGLKREVAIELAAINTTHARISPVLKLQSSTRQMSSRRRVEAIRQSRASASPPPQASSVPPPPPAARPPPTPPVEIDLDEARDKLHKERAATVVQSRARGAQARKLLNEGISNGPATARHEAQHMGSESGAPYLYVQTRHVLELEALLPPCLGVENAKAAYFEPTDCYTIRHANEMPTDLAQPPLAGMLIRQRAQNPDPVALRLSPSAKETYWLSRLPRFARASPAELRVIKASLDFATTEDDSVVQRVYARRQLVRLVLPSASLFAAVFSAAARRNAHLLAAMGLEDGDEKSPKVLSELLMPLTTRGLDVVLATVTLQRVWRSIYTRKKLQPSITQRLLRLRAASRVQRWWRWWLLKERLNMLLLVRQRVLAVDSNKLYLPTAIFEDLEGQAPLHQMGLWPEHHSLKFTFAHSAHAEVQYFVMADALRPEMPLWCAPRMPVAQTRSLQQPQEPLSLLSTGVRAALVPPAQQRSFVKRDWTCVCFQSMVEATRRVALLTAIAYEPLAARTRHGRLQGRYFHQLNLLSWSELERHEAASAIQACHLARVSRKAFMHTLKEARATRAVLHAQRQAERESNSLFAQQGPLDVPSLQVAHPPELAESTAHDHGGRHPSHFNLSREQLESMLNGQAEVLGVYGLPPVVSSADGMAEALSKQLSVEASGQREAAAAARNLVRERRAAEIASLREKTLAAARDKNAAALSARDVGDGVAQGNSLGGGMSSSFSGGNPTAPPSARMLMQMMQVVVSHRSEIAADDVAAEQERHVMAKRSHASSLRAELKQAHRELLADKELERQELLIQSRLERRQLQHALDERNRTFASEVVSKCEARRSARAAMEGRQEARKFTGSFVRQQNAMVRQLQLGDLRRRRQEELAETSSATQAARDEHERWKAVAADEARRRAETARAGQLADKADLERKRQSLETTRQRELDMVRLKQQQLHDIRVMLARPVDEDTLEQTLTEAMADTP